MRKLGDVIDEMLDMVCSPYAICMDYHPHMAIRGTIMKYGNLAQVEDYAKSVRSIYLEKGFEKMAASIVVFTATRDEIHHALECTGSVATIYEAKMKAANLEVRHAD